MSITQPSEPNVILQEAGAPSCQHQCSTNSAAKGGSLSVSHRSVLTCEHPSVRSAANRLKSQDVGSLGSGRRTLYTQDHLQEQQKSIAN